MKGGFFVTLDPNGKAVTLKVKLSDDGKSLNWKAHSANQENSVALSEIQKVEAVVLRQGREKLGLSIHHGGSKVLQMEAVSERARNQWIEGLQALLG